MFHIHDCGEIEQDRGQEKRKREQGEEQEEFSD